MYAQLSAPLKKPLNTIALCGGFHWALNCSPMMLKNASLSDNYSVIGVVMQEKKMRSSPGIFRAACSPDAGRTSWRSGRASAQGTPPPGTWLAAWGQATGLISLQSLYHFHKHDSLISFKSSSNFYK